MESCSCRDNVSEKRGKSKQEEREGEMEETLWKENGVRDWKLRTYIIFRILSRKRKYFNFRVEHVQKPTRNFAVEHMDTRIWEYV